MVAEVARRLRASGELRWPLSEADPSQLRRSARVLRAETERLSSPGGCPMLELTPSQVALLERLAAHGFQAVAFPLYANAVGVRRGNCAALLSPGKGGNLRLLGEPCYLVDGNLSVRLTRGGRQWFVWKKKQIEATPERLAEIEKFSAELKNVLLARV